MTSPHARAATVRRYVERTLLAERASVKPADLPFHYSTAGGGLLRVIGSSRWDLVMREWVETPMDTDSGYRGLVFRKNATSEVVAMMPLSGLARCIGQLEQAYTDLGRTGDL